MTKIFLFDVDKVLIHPPKYGATYTLDEINLDSSWTAEWFKTYYRECQKGVKNIIAELTPRLETCGWTKSTEDFLQAWFTYENHPDTKLLEYIQTLRENGYICAINSDQEPYRRDYILNDMNFWNLFDAFSFSCDVGFLKQEKKRFDILYDDLVTQFGPVEKHDIFYVDDQQKNIDVAAEFGIDAILSESTEKTIEEIEKRIL